MLTITNHVCRFAAVIRNNLIGTWYSLTLLSSVRLATGSWSKLLRRHMTHAVATTCMIPQKKGSF
jgi:hypothetical protein